MSLAPDSATQSDIPQGDSETERSLAFNPSCHAEVMTASSWGHSLNLSQLTQFRSLLSPSPFPLPSPPPFALFRLSFLRTASIAPQQPNMSLCVHAITEQAKGYSGKQLNYVFNQIPDSSVHIPSKTHSFRQKLYIFVQRYENGLQIRKKKCQEQVTVHVRKK